MKLVVDASVVVKWFVDEDRRDLARSLGGAGFERVAPDFLRLEVVNVPSRKLRDGLIQKEQCEIALASLSEGLVTLLPSDRYLPRAFELSTRIRHALYDCLYVAVADLEDCIFVTDDEKFGRKCLEFGLFGRVSTLRNLGAR